MFCWILSNADWINFFQKGKLLTKYLNLMDSTMKCGHHSILLYSKSIAQPSGCFIYRGQLQCVRINHAYTSVLITPKVAAPSKTQEMTFLSLFLYTINHL